MAGFMRSARGKIPARLRRIYDKLVVKYIWTMADSHTEAYQRWIDYRVDAHGARDAVGGTDLGIGQLQFEFLQREGLTPGDTLLDVGCGSLRGGRYFIDYLEAGNYVGMDINESVVEEGKALVDDDLLRKDPSFVINDDLRFEEFDRTFDYLLAQSVLTHLPEGQVRECLENVHTVMHDGSRFYLTYFDRDVVDYEGDPKSYSYGQDELAEFAAAAGLRIEFVDPSDFPHPRDQRMARVDTRG